MNKVSLYILLLSLNFYLKGQNDSLKKIKLSAISVDLQFCARAEYSNLASREHFQKFVPNDEILNSLPSSSNKGYGMNYQNHFPGIFSSKAFFDIRLFQKYKTQICIGLSYGTDQVLTLSYLNSQYDTSATYVDPVSNKQLFLVDEIQKSYQFSLVSKKILLPFAIHFTTDKNNRFWFSSGLEICPGICFSNVYIADYNLIKYKLILNENSSYDKYTSYSRDLINFDQMNTTHSKKNIPGIGFTGYVSTPFTVNIRASKKQRFLSHINIYGSLAPGFFLSANRFSKNQSGFMVNLAGGIRYNL